MSGGGPAAGRPRFGSRRRGRAALAGALLVAAGAAAGFGGAVGSSGGGSAAIGSSVVGSSVGGSSAGGSAVGGSAAVGFGGRSIGGSAFGSAFIPVVVPGPASNPASGRPRFAFGSPFIPAFMPVAGGGPGRRGLPVGAVLPEGRAGVRQEDGERPLRVDIHAHPSRFHRANVPRISDEEIARYLDRGMDAVVATISTDTPYRGGYVLRDGTRIESGDRRPEPGEPWAYTLDRFERLTRTAAEANAVFVRTPAEARRARDAGALAILPAVEGADSLEGDIERLRELHGMGLTLLQLVHFRANGLGHIQTWPYTPGGLTEFGREVVRECNRLGIVLDLAHANPETIRDTLALSTAPVVFSHTGSFALREHDRHLRDPEIRAIAEAGGVLGIWPNAGLVPTVADLARHVRRVTDLGGMGSAGIGSDLRGMSAYSEGFGDEADFEAIAEALAEAGFAAAEVDAVLGGNFERVWTAATAHLPDSDAPRPPPEPSLDLAGGQPGGGSARAVAAFARQVRRPSDRGGRRTAGVGNDPRGRSAYGEGFGDEANFEAIAEALAEAGFADAEVDAVLGGNFERVWTAATAHLPGSETRRPPPETSPEPAGGRIGGGPVPAVAAFVPRPVRRTVARGGSSLGIGSDRRGRSAHGAGLGEDENFAALAEAGFADDEVDAVLGGGFERVRAAATAPLPDSETPRPPLEPTLELAGGLPAAGGHLR